jgi:hypothetical protein
MKYVSLDIETTDLVPNPKNILMVSLVIEDTKKSNIDAKDLPHFTCFVKQPEPISGSSYALAMNHWILDILSGRNKNPPYPVLGPGWHIAAKEFLNLHLGTKKFIAAGKNVAGFDLQFMPPEFKALFAYRTIDPSMLYIDWGFDVYPPDLKDCKLRAGLGQEVAHDVREDAMDVIRLLRKSYRTENV